ncbi:hypothetical protein ACP_2004 [Acidobacterium capsulatum ATCC 51196]|uniref:Uncharacterized protein n=1 Tax=Acidobacterium capsulatum (strain ATCC 51196 / DSM 11244 / BCRC 80197 / JCM 7670 / NBRC 15755 / NCIMB 13165 / 161) TaxID=240015 RepID=C1F8U5_ACIC5|nr:hypothetical protein ACP_2004 [Acidobacterium capsulatum ATCC 51196]
MREGAAGHDGVAAGLDGLGLEVALDVGEEADDRGSALELGLELGDQRKRLRVGVVEVEDDERRALLFRRVSEPGDALFVRALEEAHLDAGFARDFVDFGIEEEIVNEAEDARGRVLTHGDGRLVGRVSIAGDVAVGAAVAAEVHGGRGGVGHVAVGGAVAVVHGADEGGRLLALLLLALLAAVAAAVSVAGVLLLLEELFLLARRLATAGLLAALALALALILVLRGALRLAVLLAALALFAATPSAAAVGGRVLLAVGGVISGGCGGRRKSCRRFCEALGLVLLWCHACTSWCTLRSVAGTFGKARRPGFQASVLNRRADRPMVPRVRGATGLADWVRVVRLRHRIKSRTSNTPKGFTNHRITTAWTAGIQGEFFLRSQGS